MYIHLDFAMARDDKKITEDEKDDKKYEEKFLKRQSQIRKTQMMKNSPVRQLLST